MSSLSVAREALGESLDAILLVDEVAGPGGQADGFA